MCYSYSKSLSLAGERIGYIFVNPAVTGSRDVYAAVCGAGRKLGFVCAPSLMQYAVAKNPHAVSDISAYRQNRDILYNALCSFGYDCVYPDGAFYLFVRSPIADAKEFCERAKSLDLLLVPISAAIPFIIIIRIFTLLLKNCLRWSLQPCSVPKASARHGIRPFPISADSCTNIKARYTACTIPHAVIFSKTR